MNKLPTILALSALLACGFGIGRLTRMMSSLAPCYDLAVTWHGIQVAADQIEPFYFHDQDDSEAEPDLDKLHQWLVLLDTLNHRADELANLCLAP